MSDVRKCLDAFKEVATSPRKQLDKVLAEGKKAIGVIPYYAPEEIAYAAGMIPFGMWGAEVQVTESKKYFPAFYCSIVHACLDLAIKGAYKGLSAVMIPLTCDSLKGMGANWQYGVKDIPVIDVAYAQNRKILGGIDFTTSQFKKIRNQLQEVAGVLISDKAVAEAIKVYDENRAVCLEFTKLVAKHSQTVSVTDRAYVLKARYFMDRKEHTEWVKALNGMLAALPEEAVKGKKIVTTGIMADTAELLKILDDFGFTIVADQITHESVDLRQETPADFDPFRAMALRLAHIEGTSVLFEPEKLRGKQLVEIAKEAGADGVLWVNTKFCDPEEFDYVPCKKALDEADIPNLQIEVDQQMVNYEQIRTALETFRDIL